MKKDKFITDFEDIPTPRQKMPHLSMEERKLNFKEVDLGFPEEIALKETSRCLSCRRCIGCGLCLAECDQRAIVYDQTEQYSTVQVDAIVMAMGAENFDARRKPELGYSHYPDVITTIEMERILAANGPYGGILMRPSDGEIPQRIAFIQCVGSRDDDLGANYCSNICCTTALKQSMLAMDKIAGLEVTIFYSEFRPYAKNSEQYYLKAKSEYGIKFVPAKVTQVSENAEQRHLTVKYSINGGEETADFDLIILSTGITPSTSIKRLSRQVDARLNKYGFFPGSDQMPVPTAGTNVWLAGSMTHPTDLSMSLAQASAVAAKVMQSLMKKELRLNNNTEPPIKVKERTSGERIGVFFCRYGLSSQLNVDNDDVMDFITSSKDGVYVSDLEYGCNTTGKQAIIDAIEQEHLKRVIIAPCYDDPKHFRLFQKLIESAGIPNHQLSILTVDHQNKLNTEEVKQRIWQLIASDQKLESVPDSRAELNNEAAVIGDSLSALQSAVDIAEQGFKVHLLIPGSEIADHERQIFWHSENIDNILNNLIQQVSKHPDIQIYNQSIVHRLDGDIGNYQLSFQAAGQERLITVGAMILSPGTGCYQPTEFLYGKNKNVITQFELTKLLSEKNIPSEKMVMIQCVGSRQPDRPYCSQICCEQALKNALKIKGLQPAVELYILHRDIRVYDFAEELYAEAAAQGVKFIRMDQVPELTSRNGKFEICVVDGLTNQPVQLEAELVVLSNGIRPPPDTRRLAALMDVILSQDQCFLETNNPLKPLQTNRPGIFVAGLAHSPQRLEHVLMQASAVAGNIAVMFRTGKLF